MVQVLSPIPSSFPLDVEMLIRGITTFRQALGILTPEERLQREAINLEMQKRRAELSNLLQSMEMQRRSMEMQEQLFPLTMAERKQEIEHKEKIYPIQLEAGLLELLKERLGIEKYKKEEQKEQQREAVITDIMKQLGLLPAQQQATLPLPQFYQTPTGLPMDMPIAEPQGRLNLLGADELLQNQVVSASVFQNTFQKMLDETGLPINPVLIQDIYDDLNKYINEKYTKYAQQFQSDVLKSYTGGSKQDIYNILLKYNNEINKVRSDIGEKIGALPQEIRKRYEEKANEIYKVGIDTQSNFPKLMEKLNNAVKLAEQKRDIWQAMDKNSLKESAEYTQFLKLLNDIEFKLDEKVATSTLGKYINTIQQYLSHRNMLSYDPAPIINSFESDIITLKSVISELKDTFTKPTEMKKNKIWGETLNATLQKYENIRTRLASIAEFKDILKVYGAKVLSEQITQQQAQAQAQAVETEKGTLTNIVEQIKGALKPHKKVPEPLSSPSAYPPLSLPPIKPYTLKR